MLLLLHVVGDWGGRGTAGGGDWRTVGAQSRLLPGMGTTSYFFVVVDTGTTTSFEPKLELEPQLEVTVALEDEAFPPIVPGTLRTTILVTTGIFAAEAAAASFTNVELVVVLVLEGGRGSAFRRGGA